jgi:hypothetical protein
MGHCRQHAGGRQGLVTECRSSATDYRFTLAGHAPIGYTGAASPDPGSSGTPQVVSGGRLVELFRELDRDTTGWR